MHRRSILLCIWFCSTVRAQVVMRSLEPGESGRLYPSDAAILDLREVRTSLPCAVKQLRPELGFDLAFHTGYEVRLHLRDLASGGGDVLTSIFRVTPDSNPDRPVFFEQKWRVPAIPEDANGATALQGGFALGEGDYQVDWLIRDKSERVCSAYWKISTRMPSKEGTTVAGLPPGTVLETESDKYSEPEISRQEMGKSLTVSILLNVAPQRPGAPVISPAESDALVSMLRGIFRDPRIGRFSLTAFNLDLRQVIFQKQGVREIDFNDLKKVISDLNLGTVTLSRLAEKNAEARFLVHLAAEQTQSSRPDAIIFLGPKSADDTGVSREPLKQLADVSCPVFYLTYTPQDLNPWRDLIGSAVKYLRGREFSISRPLDMVSAWSKIMTQLSQGNSLRTEK